MMPSGRWTPRHRRITGLVSRERGDKVSRIKQLLIQRFHEGKNRWKNSDTHPRALAGTGSEGAGGTLSRIGRRRTLDAKRRWRVLTMLLFITLIAWETWRVWTGNELVEQAGDLRRLPRCFT